jgi:hypothetical protein
MPHASFEARETRGSGEAIQRPASFWPCHTRTDGRLDRPGSDCPLLRDLTIQHDCLFEHFSNATALTQYVTVADHTYAYRQFGSGPGTSLQFQLLVNLM